jgi:hypothetical protein
MQLSASYLPSATLSTGARNGLSGKLFEPKASFSRAVTCEAQRASMAFFAIDGDAGCFFSLLTFFLGMQKDKVFYLIAAFWRPVG